MDSRKSVLVTGPTKSGKSEWAEQLAVQAASEVVYVATATCNAGDADWQNRIARHRQRRPDAWHTLEEPQKLAHVLRQAQPPECWLVDSLGTWLANHLDQSDEAWQRMVIELVEAIATFPGTLIMVAEETGWGIVPAYPSGRLFRDRLGELTREVGAIADETYLVAAGFAINLTAIGTPVK
jgi:adenosylcobinamide kinase/adenosylcobinamide-phosphate guanylyltransferase